jgi:IS5 family transposase
MKRIAAIAGEGGAKLRDRSRSVKRRILEIGRAARSKGGAGKERLQQGYRKLLAATSRVVVQAKRFSREIETGVKRSGDLSSNKPPSKACAKSWTRWRRESSR